MTRAVICDDCGKVLETPGPVFSIDYQHEEDWDDADFCPECFPDELEKFLDTKEGTA